MASDVPACLIVFAKSPVLGRVKTRMRPFLSEEDCLQLHRVLLRLWMSRLRNWDLGHVRKAVFLTRLGHDGLDPELKLDLPADVAVEAQRGADLGQRLCQALNQKWCEGFRKLVFIGTDSPLIEVEDIQAAFQALDRNEVVLGPASDGGYYLIGFSTLLPMLFSGISWGTSEVFRETTELLGSHSISWQRLRECPDLDTYEDLVNLHHLLRDSPAVLSSAIDPELTALVARLVESSTPPQCL